MKDSGIEWVGEIPKEWKIGRIGGLYTLRNQRVSDKDFISYNERDFTTT